MIDVAAVRADTPGVANVAHFNNAGASLVSRPVYETVALILKEEYLGGGYETARAHDIDLKAVYTSLAALVGGTVDEIAVVENATVAWQQAFYGMQFQPGDQVLTTTSEYGANFVAYLQMAERRGIVVDVVPDTPAGEIDVGALEAMITERTKLISINHMPTSNGLVNPAADVGRVARAAGVPFLLDACQTLGQMPVDVGEIGCDMLTGTSRKFLRGPRGVGFLWVRQSMLDRLEPIVLDHHAAEWTGRSTYELAAGARRFENWETMIAAKIGFGAAVDYALDLGLDSIWERNSYLASELRSGLGDLDRVTLHDRGAVQGAIVMFDIDGVDPVSVRDVLYDQGINVSYSTRDSSVVDFDRRGVQSLVRASVHYFNTEDEIARLVQAVAGLVR
ncbi:MAG: aminotransferase class V-fold PLP-dependent enzyme [Actinobacteria bacterium]|nr:aminotransferase class V-fold PLP-dependent enzyme [Actinomycetota bacterium]